MKIFNESKEVPENSTSVFSWRKAGTALIFLVFGYACIGYLHANSFKELPDSYQLIIAGVFVFYFGKNSLNNIKLTNKNEK